MSFRCNALFLSGFRQWQRTGLYRWRSTLLSIGVSPSVVPFPRVIPNRVGDRLRSCSLSQTIHSQTQGAIKRDPSSPFFLLLFFIPFLLPCPPYRYSPLPLHPSTPVHIHSLLPTIDCIQLSPLTAVPPIAQIIRNLTLIPTLHNKLYPLNLASATTHSSLNSANRCVSLLPLSNAPLYLIFLWQIYHSVFFCHTPHRRTTYQSLLHLLNHFHHLHNQQPWVNTTAT